MSVFKLPDLGGRPGESVEEVEIRRWHVRKGDTVEAGQPLVSVETSKTVLDLPSPHTGRIVKLYGRPGDIKSIGKPLVEFAMAKSSARGVSAAAAALKVSQLVRALAHRLNVDLTIVTPSGPDGTITQADVQRVHKILTEIGPPEALTGSRRAMAGAMSQARDEVMHSSVTDDAVLHAWGDRKHDMTLRLIRALTAAVKAEPALNAWFHQAEPGRRVLGKIHLGMTVDTPEGQFVVVLQDVGSRSEASLRKGVEKMKADASTGTIPMAELRGYTIVLSNFGQLGGKYAMPVILPPTVAAVAAGKTRDAVVPVDGKPAIAKVLPLSVTVDHRAVTSGEAARFLAAMIKDLEKAT